jgi:hypothetical protein
MPTPTPAKIRKRINRKRSYIISKQPFLFATPIIPVMPVKTDTPPKL